MMHENGPSTSRLAHLQHFNALPVSPALYVISSEVSKCRKTAINVNTKLLAYKDPPN